MCYLLSDLVLYLRCLASRLQQTAMMCFGAFQSLGAAVLGLAEASNILT